MASWAARASNLLGAVTKGRPVSRRDLGGERLGEALSCALRPVPTAVPPCASGRAAAGRPRPGRCRCAPGRHSRRTPGPSVSGVASCRWVRPILTMSANSSALSSSACVQMLERRQQLRVRISHRRGDVHRGREGVVRGLAAIDVVVGMDRRLAAALARQHLVGPVGDHLVGVHVGLGAGAGLPDHQRELVVELAVDDLLGGRGDGLAELRVELAQPHVGRRRRLLDAGRAHGSAAPACARRRSGSSAGSAGSARPNSATGPRSRPWSRSRCGSSRRPCGTPLGCVQF